MYGAASVLGGEQIWGAHTPRVFIAAPSPQCPGKEKFAMASAPSPAREARALPRENGVVVSHIQPRPVPHPPAARPTGRDAYTSPSLTACSCGQDCMNETDMVRSRGFPWSDF